MERGHNKSLPRSAILLTVATVLVILLAVGLASGGLESLCNTIGNNSNLIRNMTAFLLVLVTNPSL